MRTEAQKKQDEKAGLRDVDVHFESATGQIVESGTIHRKIDPRKFEETMPQYKDQIEQLELHIGDLQRKFDETKDLMETDDDVKFAERSKRMAQLATKKGIKEQLEAKLAELEFHQENYHEQVKLMGQYREWAKNNPRQVIAQEKAGPKEGA